MRDNSALYLGLLALVAVTCAIIIAYRLQKLNAQRLDAERRAAVAFEEMNRMTKELRTRRENDPAGDPSLSPGERLQRMYPGPHPGGAPGQQGS